MPKDKIPSYHHTHPPDLVTIEALKLEGRQPADGQPVAALFNLRTGDREHLCGLYRRTDAVPLPAKEPT
ncbi:hypothetical protein [Deinococcus aquatilis]|jgi:hypothetical protein|uniref:hypothetical protein n=1 Tax=Deinococcus aquatilis TaxID=519440 RepID=UPI00037DCC15|nr:hypothetical protein [Deinococcus aquatilis]